MVKKASSDTSLIPLGEDYLDAGFNVLLIGYHGVGKTEAIKQLCSKKNVKMKYYSCSTLDPHTDLVGVPIPQKDENGIEHLKMIRPRDIDDAEFIFFDEFNRADRTTMNAVFEIIQFKSINGERLPNLKCCWAAINPPADEYEVEEIDPALMDRFHCYIEIKPTPSISYMSQFIDPQLAAALKTWYDGINGGNKKRDAKDYISPRRLLNIGMVYEATKNRTSIKHSIPRGANVELNKLFHLIDQAEGKTTKVGETIGAQPADFNYTPGAMSQNIDVIKKYINNNPEELETQRSVISGLTSTNISASSYVVTYGEILNSMAPAIVEGFLEGLQEAQKTEIKEAYANLPKTMVNKLKKLGGIIETI